jgi:autotransporter adhesin
MAATAYGYISTASGIASTALGHNTIANSLGSTAVGVSAHAQAQSATSVGQLSTASGAASTAIGARSSATADNSVALGAGSVADQANTVSVGAAGSERRIANVSAGINATDAVNFGQLSAATAGLSTSIAGLQSNDEILFDLADRNHHGIREANEGVAMALALDSPSIPAGAKFAVSGGIGYFKNRAAFAAAISAAVGQMSSVSAGVGYGFSSNEVGARGGFQFAW